MAKALVTIYGDKRWTEAEGKPEKIISQFETAGMDGHPEADGVYIFVFSVDYSELAEVRSGPYHGYPRARFPYPLFAHKWDQRTRQGEYFTFPYCGRIEIEAL